MIIGQGLFLVCSIFLVLEFCCSFASNDKVTIVKDERGKYHILYLAHKKSRLLPNENAVTFLNFSLSSITTMRDNELAQYVDDFKVPILADFNDAEKTPYLRIISKTMALSPTYFWKHCYLIPRVLNPSIARWHDRLIVAWRYGL